jgi:hypothetical protein
MYFDSEQAIVMEQNPPGDPGNLGDSMAETCRYQLIDGTTGQLLEFTVRNFRTRTGYVRHPESPWREDDMSGDNLLPFYILHGTLGSSFIADEVEERIKDAGWRTGNGKLISLQFAAVMARRRGYQSSLTDLPLLAQALWLRLFSWTYSDGVADHLNHYHALKHARVYGDTLAAKLARLITPHKYIMKHIRTYYAKEPNSHWVVDTYQRQNF